LCFLHGWFVCLFVANAPSAQTPVTHQMTAMSISREENSGETEELIKTEEASSASSSSGRWFGLCTSLNDADLASRCEQQVQYWPVTPGDGCYLPAGKVHLARELRRKQFVSETGRRENAVPQGRPTEIVLWAEG